VLQRILEFPSFFVHPAYLVFLNVVAKNCFEQVILTVVATMSDKRKDVWTLGSLRDWMLNNARPQLRDSLLQILNPEAMDAARSASLARAVTIRNKLLAHINEDLVIAFTKPRGPPSLGKTIHGESEHDLH
jgi:hypothetical protein